MLGPMDSSAAATGPLVVLGAAVLGLVVLAVIAVVLAVRARSGVSRPPPATDDEQPRAEHKRDDLATFSAHPPGFPGAIEPVAESAPVPLMAPPAAPRTPEVPDVGPAAPGLPVGRFLLALAALALLLVAGAAAAALPSARGADSTGRSASVLHTAPATTSSAAPGAGELAYTSLPLERGDVAVRMVFGGLVLERRAVGVTATYPGVSLTASRDRALVHLRLPTMNCLTAEAPVEPEAAGCVPSVTEYGDLGPPALTVSRDGTRLVLEGRIPTYTRPNGSAPVYTGRVYGLTLTVAAERPLPGGRSVADGVLTLGSATSRTDGAPSVNVFQQVR
jgi:hypothetical protein